jgi:hypothetical protein
MGNKTSEYELINVNLPLEFSEEDELEVRMAMTVKMLDNRLPPREIYYLVLGKNRILITDIGEFNLMINKENLLDIILENDLIFLNLKNSICEKLEMKLVYNEDIEKINQWMIKD